MTAAPASYRMCWRRREDVPAISQTTNCQRLRNTLDHVWQTARQNRLEREEYEKTIRLLSLFDKR
jgi:hypothetical protein